MVSIHLPRFLPFILFIQIFKLGNFPKTFSTPLPGLGGGVDWDTVSRPESRDRPLPEMDKINEANNATVFVPLGSKIGKRDLWELVSASSDVISMESDINSNRSTSPRIYNPIYNAPPPNNAIPPHFNLQMRLHKLDYYFRGLRIFEEDCRQRFLCEISRDQDKYTPLSGAFLDETSYSGMGSEKILSARLLTSNEGTRLLTYIEASQRGLNREGCDVWMYRCPQGMDSLIDFKSLLTWREVIKWLTVKMVAKRKY